MTFIRPTGYENPISLPRFERALIGEDNSYLVFYSLV